MAGFADFLKKKGDAPAKPGRKGSAKAKAAKAVAGKRK